MLDTERLCMGCMNDNGGEKICPICGYEKGNANGDCLPVKLIIKDRYLVGKVLSINGAEITYIGWDTAKDSIINIKEYFPEGFAHRNPDKTVSIIKGGEYTFNEGLMEFAEINRVIMNSELPSLVAVSDVFEENGTIYAISAAVTGITLERFLEKNGGTLKWEQARALFLPLIDTIKGMNDVGIVHRAISTNTIIVGRDGKLRITGYSIRRLRLTGSGLETELFSGYAAVEQYDFEGMHDGNYTDVYGLSATIFKVLIGNVPPVAINRIQSDIMSIPARFAEELPRHVLAALANGLQVLPQDRTKDIETFKNELVYGEITNATSTRRSKNISNEKTAPKEKKKGDSAKYAALSAVITAGVFVILSVVLVFGVFRDDIFGNKGEEDFSSDISIDAPVVESIGTVDSGAEVTAKLYSVPDFKGKKYAEILEDEAYEMFEFEQAQTKNYSDSPKGTVCAQSIAAKTDVVRDTKIVLTISLGPKEIKIANIKGMDEINAKLELLKQGFLYENIEVLEKYDEEKDPGVVLEQDPKHSSKVSPDAAVKIYINSYKGEEE